MQGQKALLAANWKMNPVTAADAADLVRGVLDAAQAHVDHVEVALFPPFPWLLGVAEILEGTAVELGAQDCNPEKSGAYTGEVSAQMLAGWCDWVIVGHSERRQHFGETDETTARRAEAALAAGLSVIACVGELEAEREAGETEEVLRRQVAPLPEDDELVVAYEPVWAIGTGKSATPDQAREAHAFVKGLLDAPVLYGGSVTPETAGELLSQEGVDGALVGGASLDVDSFAAICDAVAQV